MNEHVAGEAKRREPVDHSKNANQAATAPSTISGRPSLVCVPARLRPCPPVR